MRRAAENRPGAVFHQHEIGDPDGVAGAWDEGVGDPHLGIKALLFASFNRHNGRAGGLAFGDEGRDLRIARGDGGRQRMFRRDRQEGHAEQRIRPGGVNRDIGNPGFRLHQIEGEPRALTAADPVGLHQPHPFRPAIQIIQRGQQIRRELGDPHGPLVQLFLFHRRAGPPALAVNHLFIGEHGAVNRVPVHPAFLPFHQAGGHEFQK